MKRKKGSNKMTKYLLGAALLALSAPAYAGTITYTTYSTPDSLGSNDVTTTATGASDTPYSYYTGPVVLTLTDNSMLPVYCADLNNYLAGSGTYTVGILNKNGEGQTISEFNSNRIGHIAALGFAALAAGGEANLDLAAAAQAAIWDISYDMDSAVSTVNGSTADDLAIQADITTFLTELFANTGYAIAYIPINGSVNQEMVGGLSSTIPEPSTWAMMLTGFALIGGFGWRRARTPRALSL